MNKQPKQPKAMRVFQAAMTNPYFPKVFTQGGITMEKLGLTVASYRRNPVLFVQTEKRGKSYLQNQHMSGC